MNELGQWLREAREAKGRSLAEVEATTRIRQKFLAALEAEEWDNLPDDVTSIGFLRKYATYLGLDPQQAVERFRARNARRPLPPPPPEIPSDRPVDYRPMEMDLEVKPPRQIPWRPIVAAVAVLLVLAGIWWVLTFQRGWLSRWSAFLPEIPLLGGPAPTATPEILATPTRIVIRVTATPTATSPATPTPTSTPTPLPEVEGGTAPVIAETATPELGPVIESLVLQMETTQRSWVSVNVDGQKAMETTLEPGEIREWEGRRSISLRTGNAAGVALVMNGQPVGPLGGPGEIVALQWNLVDGAVIQSTPEPAATEIVATPSATPTPAEG